MRLYNQSKNVKLELKVRQQTDSRQRMCVVILSTCIGRLLKENQPGQRDLSKKKHSIPHQSPGVYSQSTAGPSSPTRLVMNKPMLVLAGLTQTLCCAL